MRKLKCNPTEVDIIMSTSIKKTLLLTLGGIGLVVLGAFSTWGIGKVLTLSPVAVSSPAAPVASPAAIPAPTAAAPATATVVAANPATSAVVATTVTTTTTASQPTAVVVNTEPAGPVLAKIIRVKPHYVVKTVAQRVCRDVPRTVVDPREGPSGVGAVLGGVAGGIAGHQIGQGRGNVAATIGGAILGAAVGNQVERNVQQPQTRVVYETVCSTEYVQKSVRSGYEVTYLYNGEQGTIIMKKRPIGKTIPLTLKP